MPIRLICIGIILSIFLLTNACSSKGIHGYEPKSPDEEAIVSVFRELEKTWNNGDIEGNLAQYHENAKITASMHTKVEFEKHLSSLMERYPEIRYTEPSSIDISNDTATVKIWTTVGGSGRYFREFETYNFVKENNLWLIIRSIHF